MHDAPQSQYQSGPPNLNLNLNLALNLNLNLNLAVNLNINRNLALNLNHNLALNLNLHLNLNLNLALNLSLHWVFTLGFEFPARFEQGCHRYLRHFSQEKGDTCRKYRLQIQTFQNHPVSKEDGNRTEKARETRKSQANDRSCLGSFLGSWGETNTSGIEIEIEIEGQIEIEIEIGGQIEIEIEVHRA